MSVPFNLKNVYEWEDLRQAICEEMGIEEGSFRNYHKVVGGEYKDLWHVALATFIPDNMANDTVVTLYGVEDQIDGDDFWLKGRPWARPFLEAYAKVMEELDPECNGVLVSFSW